MSSFPAFSDASIIAAQSETVSVGETPNAATLVGGGITLAGVLLFNYGAAWLGKRRQAASIQ